ncbi:MerR family transcriptional regulator, partial [bacterium]
MKLVVKRTGLSPHVIRVWERRYQALAPDRSPTNRRMYSEAEVARLERLARLTDFGHSISQIAQLPDADLETLVAGLPAAPQARPKLGSGQEDPLPYLEACLEKIESLDGKGLEELLDRASLAFSQQVLLE